MWQPIIALEDQEPYWNAIEEIECALLRISASDRSATGIDIDPLLASGMSGLALFFAYFDVVRHDTEAGDYAIELLGQSIDALAHLTIHPSLYSGFCGVGWAVEHLTRDLYDGDDDLTGAIDAALRGHLENAPERLRFELINGLSGFGVYLLERLPHPDAEELLRKTLDHLAASTEESPNGCTWFTSNDWIPSWQRESLPNGCYNLGVAHGVTGVVGFLAAAQSAGLSDPRIPRLAEGAVRWLLRHRLPAGSDSVFPALVVPGKELKPTRTAWCNGDLGVASVLLTGARAFGRSDWEKEALTAAQFAARRPLQPVMAIDAGLCHGAAGLGHLFNRMYQTTGDPDLKEAARAWYRRTLAMRVQGQGIAGFLAWTGTLPGDGSWQGDPGFLLGVSGIGLALLAAVSEVEPAWDRLLLASPTEPAKGCP
jgi:lantibiotic modifying enzyme